MTALETIHPKYRDAAQSEREKGTYFRFESTYTNFYSGVWLFADWAREIGTPQFGISAKDTGIDPKPMKCAVSFCLVIKRLEGKARIESIALAS